MSELSPETPMSESPKTDEQEAPKQIAEQIAKQIGRNEPCPCGSGKKYKRCHGVGAAPKVTPPRQRTDLPAGEGQAANYPDLNPEMLANLDPSKVQMPAGLEGVTPEMMSQVAQMLQRLPKGQLQRLQSIMQRAMAGKDVTREAQEFEKTLPPEFQKMLSGIPMPGLGNLPEASQESPKQAAEASSGEMTPEQAREIVARAAAEGKISQEQAQELLAGEKKSK